MESIAVIENRTELVSSQSINNATLDSYIAFIDASENTTTTYKKDLKQLFTYFTENHITHPTRADILSWKEYLKATGHKPTTIQNYITAAKVFFKWTAQEGLYPNIAEHIKGAKLDKQHKKDALTTRQVKDVLCTMPTETEQQLRDYAIITLMITGGLRTVEVSRANYGDLRPLGDETVLYIQGKGHTERTDYIKIDSKVEKAIRAYLKARGTITEEQPLFASLSNNSYGERLSTRTISGIAKTAMRAAGYDSERLTAHSLRHTAVTLSLLANKPIEEVSQFARHANLSTTLIYAHHLEKAQNSCSKAIAEAIF